MREMTLGSLFDGSGGFPLGGVINGIRPVWASEIEPYPLKVTAARFPHMKQLGDVTKINGAEIEPVDIITFGSPCQDLSVAGKQAGIHDGERSSLFFEAIRIIKGMREHDRETGRADIDVRPRFAVWENVPGAFSSNGGEDFRSVLEALGGVCEDGLSIPRPKKWNHAGCVAGNGWSIAWRMYDAQYWGVPQRRKRIYLIADFGSERAGEILFEREGVLGDTETGGTAREGTAADAERSAGGSGIVSLTNRGYVSRDRTETLRAESHMALPCVIHPAAFMGGQGAKARSIAYCDDGSTPTLKSAPSGGYTIPDVVYALQGNGIDIADTAGCNGAGWRKGEMYTLNTIDRPAVCYAPTANHCGTFAEAEIGATLRTRYNYGSGEDAALVCYDARGNGDGKTAPTLTGDHKNRVTDYTAVCCGNGQLNQLAIGDKSRTLNCMHDQQIVITPEIKPDGMTFVMQRKYIVRRLTPLECCRLQGFPDWWEDGVEGSDSARYKMWGNGVSLPTVVDVIGRIAKEVRNHEE